MNRPDRPVQLALAERLSHLDQAAWTTLTREASVFLQPAFLGALEATCPANVSPRYALLYDGERPLAAAVLQLVRVQGRFAIAPSVPFGGVAQLVDERALVLGNLAAWGETGLALAPGVDVASTWREVLRLMDRLRRFEKLEGAVNVSLLKDAAHEPDSLAPVLRKQGYQQAPSGPDMVLDLDPAWHSLDDYLAKLASKRRRAVRKVLEAFEAGGYRVRRLTLADLEANEARLDALYGEVWSNADVRPLRLSGRFFVELQRRLGEDCVVTGLERDGVLSGFGVCLRSGPTCVGYYLGYDKTADAPLYLRLLVAIIEQGLAWGSQRLSMGRTAEEPKARLGATPGASSLWVKHRTPPLNWAVGAVLGSLGHAEPPAHRVFRADDAQA